MARATLRLTLPEGVWIGELSRDHPEAQFRILAALADGRAGVGLAELRGTGVESIIDEMAATGSVTDLSVLSASDDRALVQFETTLPLLLLAARDSGVPLELPFDIVDGRATWTVTADRDRIAELGEQLEAFGVEYAVQRIGSEPDPEPVLTDRQSRLLERATELGYYDTPRECTLSELAQSEGAAKSTVSEVLHRAEGAVIKWFLAERGQHSTWPSH